MKIDSQLRDSQGPKELFLITFIWSFYDNFKFNLIVFYGNSVYIFEESVLNLLC